MRRCIFLSIFLASTAGAAPSDVLVLDDLNNNDEVEAVILADLDGAARAVIKDAQTGNDVNVVSFATGLEMTDAQIADDLNGNGADELAVLAWDAAAMRPRVEVHNPRNGKLLKSISFNKFHDPIALGIIADQNGNSAEEAVVLARQYDNNDRPRLLVRDLDTKEKLINISLPKIFAAAGLVMASDFSGNGAAEALVLASRISDSKGFVLVWDTGGAGKIINVQLPNGHIAVGHDYVAGTGAVAVLLFRESDQRGRLLVYDAGTAVKRWGATLPAGRTPVAVKAFQNAAGNWRVAALMQRASGQRPIVTVFQAVTGSTLTNIFFDPDQTAATLAIVPDLGADTNDQPEMGMLADEGVAGVLRMRDSGNKALLSTIDFPPPASRPPAIQTQAAFTNLSFSLPVAMLQAPGDGSRWFIVEKSGRVLIFDNVAGASSTDVFVDITNRVNSSGNEMGLLGMAFHPDFAQNGEVFLSYTRSGPISYVSRFGSQDGGLTLDPTSEEPLLTVPQEFSNHNGGNIAFGPDGHLYIGLGDGGSANDPSDRAQDTRNLLGTMLRIDVDAGSPYGIPASNPFAGNGLCASGSGNTDCPEIFAWGLRNPWRWSFDRLTGDLWVGDVGEGDWEEVDKVVVAENYGWRIREGAQCNPNLFAGDDCPTMGLTDPVAEYSHGVGRSITGGYVYRAGAVPSLQGSYVYADFVTGRIFRTFNHGTGTAVAEELLDTALSISSFGEGVNRELFLLDYGSGSIHQIIGSP
jgi:glucose/arabinose dehydrogenase